MISSGIDWEINHQVSRYECISISLSFSNKTIQVHTYIYITRGFPSKKWNKGIIILEQALLASGRMQRCCVTRSSFRSSRKHKLVLRGIPSTLAISCICITQKPYRPPTTIANLPRPTLPRILSEVSKNQQCQSWLTPALVSTFYPRNYSF